MRETDEFEFLQRWEYSKFYSGPGTMPPKDCTLGPELEDLTHRALAVWPPAGARSGLLLRRGQNMVRTPKYVYKIARQYRTHFGYLLVIDEGSFENALRVPFGYLALSYMTICLHYRSMDDKVYERTNVRLQRLRFVPKARYVPPYHSTLVHPVVEARIVDDQTIEIELADGACFRVHVMNSPKKGPIYNWLTAFSTRQYPLVVDATHLRVRRRWWWQRLLLGHV